jgi:hypothetical protein
MRYLFAFDHHVLKGGFEFSMPAEFPIHDLPHPHASCIRSQSAPMRSLDDKMRGKLRFAIELFYQPAYHTLTFRTGWCTQGGRDDLQITARQRAVQGIA